MAQPIDFVSFLDSENRKVFTSLKTPSLIQNYLDSIPYVGEVLNRSPLRVMQDGQSHCLDGGLFAALALQKIGFSARILDLVPEPNTDDDHVLAIYQVNGKYGAIAKSNFVGLRYREAVYRSLRELAMSYFEQFYNVEGIKTLRGYTRPLMLAAYDHFAWQTDEKGVEKVATRLYTMKSIPLITSQESDSLSSTDKRSYDAGLLGVNYSGLFQPGISH